MPKNSFLKAIFSGPKFSLDPIEKTNKGTIRIGEVIPVYKTMLQGREKISLDLGHLVRFAPTSVPVMEGYEVNFDAFCVPVSALGYPQRKERDIMDFHNLALNDGDQKNPLCHYIPGDFLTNDCLRYGNKSGVANLFRIGSLGDYLNMPSFKNFRDFVRKWVYQTGLFEGGLFNKFRDNVSSPLAPSMSDIADFVARFFINSPYIIDRARTDITIDGSGRGYGIRSYLVNVPFPADTSSLSEFVNADYDSLTANDVFGTFFGTDYVSYYSLIPVDVVFGGAWSLLRYLCKEYPLLASYYGVNVDDIIFAPTTMFNHLAVMRETGALDLNYLDKLYEFYKVDAQSAFDEYFEYIMAQCLYNPNLVRGGSLEGNTLWDESAVLPDLSYKDLDWTYFAAYWKIISDWYINTNIDGDPNDFFIANAGAVFDSVNYKLQLKPFNRRWANDPFTSAVPSSRVTNVLIPSDGTIPDLREANAFQKLVDILRNTGSRLRDVMYGIRGYRPTADSTDMATPIGTLHSFVGMQSVLQTSQSSKDSPLASYAGIGTDSSRGDFKRILKVVNNTEATPVVVMVLMSITQRASYMQGLPRYFQKRDSIYDFAIPQLANIGEQEIKSTEVYFDMGAVTGESEGIFGFNRRYYDWFFEDSEIHGNMRDSEDMWHGARVFSSKPVLNSEFIGIDSSKDDLSRIFANLSPVAMPIYYNVYFGGEKVVALPRYIQYDL